MTKLSSLEIFSRLTLNANGENKIDLQLTDQIVGIWVVVGDGVELLVEELDEDDDDAKAVDA